MWWHETVRRSLVVVVYGGGTLLAILPFVATVQFLERIGPDKASDSRDIFWAGILAGILIGTLLSHKLINWIFQKGEWDGKYHPTRLTVQGDLRLEGGIDTNSQVRIENVETAPKKSSTRKAASSD